MSPTLTAPLSVGAVVALLLITLSGCATVERTADHARDFAARHRVAAAVAGAVVVGSAVALAESHHGPRRAPVIARHGLEPQR